MKHNGHQIYIENNTLFAISLLEKEDIDYDEITDKVLRDLAIHRPKQYSEHRIALRLEHVVGVYESGIHDITMIELSNGYVHRLKAPYEYVEALISYKA